MSAAHLPGRPAVERVHPPNWLMRIVNPVARAMLRRGAPRGFAQQVVLLHFGGRRSGRAYEVPAGQRMIDGRMAVLTNSGWRANFRGGLDLDVTVHGQRRPAHATLTEDPDQVAAIYEDLLRESGDGKSAGRQLGIRINVDRVPTREELRAMIAESGLSVLTLDLDRAPAQ